MRTSPIRIKSATTELRWAPASQMQWALALQKMTQAACFALALQR